MIPFPKVISDVPAPEPSAVDSTYVLVASTTPETSTDVRPSPARNVPPPSLNVAPKVPLIREVSWYLVSLTIRVTSEVNADASELIFVLSLDETLSEAP